MPAALEYGPSPAAEQLYHNDLNLLDKGKPVVRRRRKAMGPAAEPLWVARLPKGWTAPERSALSVLRSHLAAFRDLPDSFEA